MSKDKWGVLLPVVALAVSLGTVAFTCHNSNRARIKVLESEVNYLEFKIRQAQQEAGDPKDWTDFSAEQRRRIFGQLLGRYPTIFRPRNEWGFEEIPTGRPTIIPALDPDAKQGSN